MLIDGHKQAALPIVPECPFAFGGFGRQRRTLSNDEFDRVTQKDRRAAPAGGRCWTVKDLRSSVGADLHRLHAGLGFGPCFEGAVVDDGRCGCGRLLVDDGAFLRRCIMHDVVFGRGLRESRSDGECCHRAGKQ